MNGGSAAANHAKDRQKSLKQKLFKTESAKKNILSKKLCAQQNAEYLGLPVIK